MEEFLQTLLEQGHIRFDEPPVLAVGTARINRALHQALERDMLSLAGPALTLNPALALAAANYVQQTAWLLVNRDEAVEQAVQRLVMLPEAVSANDLASADLLLRYLPNLYQRAVAISPEDVLSQHLKETLLRWPLSGVLADLPDKPVGSLDFFGHRGLQLRYAERLAARPRAGWGPSDAASLDAVALVFELQDMSLDQLKVITVASAEEPIEDTHE